MAPMLFTSEPPKPGPILFWGANRDGMGRGRRGNGGHEGWSRMGCTGVQVTPGEAEEGGKLTSGGLAPANRVNEVCPESTRGSGREPGERVAGKD